MNNNIKLLLLVTLIFSASSCNFGNGAQEMGQLPLDQVVFDASTYSQKEPSPPVINLASVKDSIALSFSMSELGGAIYLDSINSYLIPAGKWTKMKEFGQIQGTYFKNSNKYYPNPDRNFNWSFNGDFQGFILVDEYLKGRVDINNLTKTKEHVKRFQIVSDQSDYWVICWQTLDSQEDPVSLRIFHINTGAELVWDSQGKKVLDWALISGEMSMVLMCQEDENQNGTWEKSEPYVTRRIELRPDDSGIKEGGS